MRNSATGLKIARWASPSNLRPWRRAGGCDFAADPGLRADQTTVIWLPRHNPRLTILIEVDPDIFGGSSLLSANSVVTHTAPEGTYVELTAAASTRKALALCGARFTHPLAVVLPLDDLFEERVDAVRRVWRAVRPGTAAAVAPFTAQRRRRLKLLLRSLDAAMLGVGYREIARGLFGDRIPVGAEWRSHHLRAQTIRLVKDGRALMRGGYLQLLRPDRRKR